MHRYCTSVKTTRKGWVPSLRVWKLEAFDGTRQIAMVEEDCGSNDIKFRRFCQLIAKKGYQLTDEQVQQLCATLALYVPTEKVEFLDDPFSQAAAFRAEWEDEFLTAQYRPSDFQRWLTLVSILFVIISLALPQRHL